jgi:hypothetical protein
MAEKKLYQKPKIKEVRMVPQEAFLSNCKAAGGGASKAGRCRSKPGCGNKTIGS